MKTGIAIFTGDKSTFVELSEADAKSMMTLVEMVARDRQEQEAMRTEPDGNQKPYEQAVLSPAELLERIAKLDKYEAPMLVAFLNLIEFGDGYLENGSWVLSAVGDLLQMVEAGGPDRANERSVSEFVFGLVYRWTAFISWTDDARALAKRYPKLLADVRIA